MTVSAWSQNPASSSQTSFAPFQQWMGAVLTGDAATLKSLYSTSPAAQVRLQSVMHDANSDTDFWLGLKPKSMNVEFVRERIRPDKASLIFQADVVGSNGQKMTLTDDQYWVKQGDQWRIVSVERTDAPKLKQPADMKKDIYPADVDAHAELKKAEETAAKAHKRILMVFGANWCFDCHVLDLAFHGPELSPILNANYEVIHIDLGPDGKKNADLVQQFDIPLDKGVPAMAIAESNGKLVVSQKNGEVEDARQLDPGVLADFLNKWKPQAQ
jgi:hypothetical protein